MNKVFIFAFLISVVLNVTALDFYAQSKPVKKAVKATVGQDKTMPLPFVGDNVREVSKALYLIRNRLSKSQFETEAEFLVALEKKLKEEKYKEKTMADLVFAFAPYEKYDAEKKEYTIYIGEVEPFPGMIDYQQPERKGLLLRLLNGDKSNGNAARYVEVGNSNIIIPLAPAEAKDAETDLMLAIYGLPIGSLTNEMFSFYITKVIVYNKKTGKIYKEAKVNQIKPT